ncbi:MAG: rod shape-determining protein MreC [Muribaculaceae bacterium]|nr:rod shape-determining protein MreC [Muribaculaceae bacterium]
MRNILHFLVKYVSWFVFAFYVIVSCVMLFRNNPYQHHVYMTSAGALAAGVYNTTNSVTSYFNLHDINEDLQRRNADLEREVISLRRTVNNLEEQVYADSMTVVEPLMPYSFIIATVINNSIARPYNYLTINKGAINGIKPEMGVVDQNGVVGVVNLVSDHYARVISLLNPNFRLSCKLKGSDVFGSLVWDGHSPEQAILEELPKHTVYHPGDTIITTGYSDVFPEGIPVGTVVSADRGVDDNFFTLRINLLTDFSQLSTVRVIANKNIGEISEIEKDPIVSKSKIAN